MNGRRSRPARLKTSRARPVRRRRSTTGRAARQGAESRLRQFRQSSIVAVAVTGLLLLLFSPQEPGAAQGPGSAGAEAPGEIPDTVSVIQQVPVEDLQAGAADSAAPPDAGAATEEATEEATGAVRDLWTGFVTNLPRYGIAFGILIFAWLVVRVLRAGLRLALRRWERADAITALSGVPIWLLATGVALSVVLGDIRVLAGSLGLVGLALSWALQTPIESFTGWLLNSFKGYYRVGDRVSVGDVFGDVYRIDFLNTTLWEIGGREQPPGWVQAEQPTGRLITFPNNEVLAGTVINYTRDFPFLWDELTVSVAAESDLTYAMEVLQGAATRLIGDHMRIPAQQYRAVLQRERLEGNVADVPEVFASLTDWGANVTIRYLVGAREKRIWKSRLAVAVNGELNGKDHEGRILPVYPRQQIQLVRSDGAPADLSWGDPGDARPRGRGTAPASPDGPGNGELD